MGLGNCVYEAPGAFDLDDDGISTVGDPAAAAEEQIIAAVRKCPPKAISVPDATAWPCR